MKTFEYGQDKEQERLEIAEKEREALLNKTPEQIIDDGFKFVEENMSQEESDRLTEEKRRENADQERADLMENWEPLEL